MFAWEEVAQGAVMTSLRESGRGSQSQEEKMEVKTVGIRSGANTTDRCCG